MSKKTRRMLDAGMKAKVALEPKRCLGALGDRASVRPSDPISSRILKSRIRIDRVISQAHC
jgi:hypothetical protein